MNAETAVIGSILADSKALVEGLSILRPEYFSDPVNADIFKAAGELHHKGEAVDVVTVAHVVEHKDRVFDAVSQCPSALNVAHYARIVRKTYLEKQVANAAWRVSEKPGDREALDGLLKSVRELDAAESAIQRMSDLVQGYLAEIDQRATGYDLRVPTGFPGFDRKINGFKRGRLVVIGGKTNSGKSSLCVRLAVNALQRKLRVLYVSGEITDIDVMDKIVTLMTGQNARKVESVRIKEIMPQVTGALAKINPWEFYFMAPRELSLAGIETAIDAVRPDVVFVDYIQMFNPKNQDNRAAFYSDVAHGMKFLAIQKKIVVVLASQFSRKADERKEDEEPSLADFKESGGIEQAAHMAILIHDKPKQRIDAIRRFPVDILVKKNKGPHGKIEMMFDEDTTDFLEVDTDAPPY